MMKSILIVAFATLVASSLGCTGSSDMTQIGSPGDTTSMGEVDDSSADSSTLDPAIKTTGNPVNARLETRKLKNRKPIAIVEKPEDCMDAWSISPDGKTMLFPKPGEKVGELGLRMINIADGKTLWERSGFSFVQGADFHPDGKHLFLWCGGTMSQQMDEGEVSSFLLNPNTGETIKEIPINRYIGGVMAGYMPTNVQHTGDRIFLLHGPGITIVDPKQGKVVSEKKWDWKIPVKAEPGVIVIDAGFMAIVVPNSGTPSRMAILNNERTVSTWDIDSDEPQKFNRSPDDYPFNERSLAILPNGDRYLSFSRKGWEITDMDGNNPLSLEISSDSSSKLIGLIPGSESVIFRTRKQGLVVFSTTSAEPQFTMSGKPKEKRRAFYEPFLITPDGKRFAAKRKEDDGKTYYSVWSLD